MAKSKSLRRTAATTAEALRRAEHEIEQPPAGTAEPHFIQIKPADIETRPEIYQPRTFSAGLKEVDGEQVKTLVRRIGVEGELDREGRMPPLVVKLKGKWVCVDGHHRLAAYVKFKWTDAIKCEWFIGTAHQAADEALRRNRVAKLEMSRGDRQEEAWRRTLNEQGSKRQVVVLTGVSEGVVAQMRRVKEDHQRQDAFGKAFRTRLPRLANASWSEARGAHLDIAPAERDMRKAAAKLARQLTKRFSSKILSDNPQVTALALALYDPELPETLVPALEDVIVERQREDEGRPPEERGAALRRKAEAALKVELSELRKRYEGIASHARAIQQELARRQETGWTSSDLTWDRWVETPRTTDVDDR